MVGHSTRPNLQHVSKEQNIVCILMTAPGAINSSSFNRFESAFYAAEVMSRMHIFSLMKKSDKHHESVLKREVRLSPDDTPSQVGSRHSQPAVGWRLRLECYSSCRNG